MYAAGQPFSSCRYACDYEAVAERTQNFCSCESVGSMGLESKQLDPADGSNPYHWFETPDGRTVKGFWDLRKSWRHYLGNFDFAGKTVLELGPASGFLGLKMEQAGAKVTAFDIAEGYLPDLLPIPAAEMAAMRKSQAEAIDQFRRTWRYYHALFGSKNEIIYGDIYNLSKSTDRRFQVTTFSAILLHLSNPFRVIEEAEKITDETIIVTDIQNPALKDEPYIEFNPNPNTRSGTGWWLFSHGAMSRMLSTVGFHRQALSFSTHRLFESPESDKFTDIRFFTIVASRGWPEAWASVHFDSYRTHNGAEAAPSGSGVSFTTPVAQWHYAISIDCSWMQAGTVVELDVQITSGAVGFGFNDAAMSRYLSEEVVAKPEDGRRKVRVVLVEAMQRVTLVARNVFGNGPSRGTIFAVSLAR